MWKDKKAEKLFGRIFSVDWANIINCTPHPCVVYSDSKVIATIEASGILPRVSVCEEVHPQNSRFPFPVVKSVLGKVENLPENDDGDKIFIVSRMVLDAAPNDRKDLIAPDTGRSAVRDEKGHILGVTQFVGR